VDLGALLSNPAFRVAAGAGGLGLFVTGVAGMMSGDRTGETTAGSPPSLPPSTPMFTEADGSPLGQPLLVLSLPLQLLATLILRSQHQLLLEATFSKRAQPERHSLNTLPEPQRFAEPWNP
jgi:hypothetical protein